ncbi:hypothetical protein AL01_01480 [Bombella intestini]|uniref:Uncharacterized protein n=1 Tax=Bombella intestini TaxID=1539051 RepID=A0A1S8GRQ6_9PROT|nr:DUF6492 family protein [Bombella intestini]OOL19665.1 hypothetical protein AL01_01480 [Bombella intestini]
MLQERVSILTPSYEKHVDQYFSMVRSIKKFCTDFHLIDFVVVLERVNNRLFEKRFEEMGIENFRIVETEQILSDWGVGDTASSFLKRVGKFTFQTSKKLGAFKYIKTEWAIILDSEGLFLKRFSIRDILDDYKKRKYIFYSGTEARGQLWNNSLGCQVNKNVSHTLKFNITSRWFMECFHWFYETQKVNELIEYCRDTLFFSYLTDKKQGYSDFLYEGRHVDFFENILYYGFLWKKYNNEYVFFDLKEEFSLLLPKEISGRFILDELPFSLFGNDYILNILAPEDIKTIYPFLEKFRLPFLRLEPAFFDTRYLLELEKAPYLVSTISSHHAIWLKKRIAVCISGEFRHKIHRVPEQQVRMLKSFLSGVECDVFIHGWHSTSEALIINELKPKKYLFEERKDFTSLVEEIWFREPRLKEGRDHGSLSMFYSLEQAFNLIGNDVEQYDFVVRLRPDIYPDLSLKDILIKITDLGDFNEGSIYFPRNYHSKGINDQIAIGETKCMETYFRTFSYIKKNISELFFNPEYILLKNILEHQIKPLMVDLPYALMRELPMKIFDIGRVLHDQEHIWWSKTDNLPISYDLSEYFTDKLKSMETLMFNKITEPLYISFKNPFTGQCWVEVINNDNNPSVEINLYKKRGLDWCVIPFAGNDVLNVADNIDEMKKFFYQEDDKYVLSFWSWRDGEFTNRRVVLSANAWIAKAPFARASRDKAWKKYIQVVEKFHDPDRKWMAHIYLKPYVFKLFYSTLRLLNQGDKKRKLLENPRAFCRDSKVGLVRSFGRKYFM